MFKKLSYKFYLESYIGLFVLFALVLPKLIALLFIGFLPLIIVGLRKKKLKFTLNFTSVLFISLYLIYILYIVFTRNPDLAKTYSENKLSFLLLPLFLAFRLKEGFSFKIPIHLFLLGVLIMLCQYYWASFSCYMGVNGGRNCFLTSSFSYSHHPTYTSVYLLMALVALFYAWKQKYTYFKLFWIIPTVMLILIAYVQCLSLAGILFLFVLCAILLIYGVYSKFGKIIALLSLIISPFLIYLTIISIPQIEGEWTNAKWYFDQYVKNPTEFAETRQPDMSGTEVRIVMWTVAVESIKQFPLGVGTGNVDEILTANLKKIGQHELAEHEYNPHNQYFQTWIETGFFGFLILFLILIFSIYYGFKYRNWALVILAFSLAFNMIFESMLQRQDGIVFYTFVLNLLVIYSKPKQEALTA